MKIRAIMIYEIEDDGNLKNVTANELFSAVADLMEDGILTVYSNEHDEEYDFQMKVDRPEIEHELEDDLTIYSHGGE